VDPVEIQQLALAAFASAAIVLFGALYAIFFALSRMHNAAVLARLALASYGLLAVAAIVLGVVLRVEGLWAALIVTLLVGYFVAPRLIWRLNLAVHGAPDDSEEGDSP
jgi:hypothetical protein